MERNPPYFLAETAGRKKVTHLKRTNKVDFNTKIKIAKITEKSLPNLLIFK